MSMPTDAEMEELLKYDGPITDKIKMHVSRAEERILKQIRPLAEKVEEHDNAFREIGRGISTGFGSILSVVGKVTGKRTAA